MDRHDLFLAAVEALVKAKAALQKFRDLAASHYGDGFNFSEESWQEIAKIVNVPYEKPTDTGANSDANAATDDEHVPATIPVTRVYNNGDVVEFEYADAKEVMLDATAAMDARPGCAYFINGVCVQRGYLDITRVEALQRAFKTTKV